MQRQLSADYASLYERLLARVASAAPAQSHRLTSFWPMCGERYDGRLMVIGRAVNGWRHDFDAVSLHDPGARAEVVQTARVQSEAPSGEAPMMWVLRKAQRPRGQYSTTRSAFWRTIRRLWRLQPGSVEQDWPSYLCWSNLYKVSPQAGGNPSSRLREHVLGESVALIRQEIAEFAPRCVIVLAGAGGVRPFAKTPWGGMQWGGGLFEGGCRQEGRLWLVAPHPQGRPEGRLVSEVGAVLAEVATPS